MLKIRFVTLREHTACVSLCRLTTVVDKYSAKQRTLYTPYFVCVSCRVLTPSKYTVIMFPVVIY